MDANDHQGGPGMHQVHHLPVWGQLALDPDVVLAEFLSCQSYEQGLVVVLEGLNQLVCPLPVGADGDCHSFGIRRQRVLQVGEQVRREDLLIQKDLQCIGCFCLLHCPAPSGGQMLPLNCSAPSCEA